MQITVYRKEFLKAWNLINRFTIDNIQITTNEDGATLEGMNWMYSCKVKTDSVIVKEPGQCIIPVKLFGDIIKKIQLDEFTLEVDEHRALMRCGNNKLRFAIIPLSDLKVLPASNDSDIVCKVKASNLIKAVNEGSIAAGKPNDFPKYMGQCFLQFSAGYMKVVSTDGKRLAFSKVECESVTSDTFMLIKAQGLKNLVAILEADDEIEIFANETLAWFKTDKAEFSIRLSEGLFPTYERIIDKEIFSWVNVKTDDLISVLERVNIIASKNMAHPAIFTLNPDRDEIEIFSRQPEVGSVFEKIECEVQERPLTIGFHIDYFMAGLRALGSCDAFLEFSGEDKQIRMYRNDSNDFLYMLMPMRLTYEDKITEEDIKDFEDTEA